MAPQRQEELSERYISQLASRVQRRPDDVRDIKGHAVVEDFWRNRVPRVDHRVRVPRFGSPGDEQFLPNQSVLAAGATVFDVDDGAPPLRSMPYDLEQRGKSDSIELVAGRLLASGEGSRGGDPLDRFSGLLSEEGGLPQLGPKRYLQLGLQRSPGITPRDADDGVRFGGHYQTLAHREESGGVGQQRILRTGRYGEADAQYYSDRHYEPREGGSAANDASRLHRFDLPSHLRGIRSAVG